MSELEDRHLARRVAARVEFRDVRIARSNFKLSRIPIGGALSYTLEESSQVGWKPGQKLFTLNCDYVIDVTETVVVEQDDSDLPTEAERDVADIHFVLAGLFELAMRPDDAEMTEAEITAYCSTTGAFALYPFAREYASNVTGRLGLPSLTLPVKLVPVAKDESLDFHR